MLNTQHLGPYVVSEQLRQDATGTIHRGVHGTTNDPVTIKLLPERYGQDPELVARFNRLVELIRGLDHPGIVKILDHGESPQGLYLVMERLTGEPLAERLKREPRLPLEETQRIVGAVASALAAAHRERLVHRDLSADSVFLVQPPVEGQPAEVKLLDLGLARLLEPAPVPAGKSAASTRGTDKRADIKALGRVAYQMLSGEAPVESGADEAGNDVRKRPARLSTHGVTVPQSVEAAIMKALLPKKKRRFSSMTEFAVALGADIEPELEPEILESPEPEVLESPEPEVEVEMADGDLASLAERPLPPPLPAPRTTASQLDPIEPMGPVAPPVLGPTRTAQRRPKVVAIAAAASVAVLAGGWLVVRSVGQSGTVAVAPPAPVAVARAVDVARAVPEPAAPTAPTKVDEILALNQKAVSAYEQGDVKTARGLLLQADKLALDSGFKDAPVRAQTQVRLGALFVAQKKPRLGRPYLIRAVAINPAVRIPPGMMSPRVHKTLIATKQKARLAKNASVTGSKRAKGQTPRRL
jgi:eukaryotic-like serine/threonine-protein kinase